MSLRLAQLAAAATFLELGQQGRGSRGLAQGEAAGGSHRHRQAQAVELLCAELLEGATVHQRAGPREQRRVGGWEREVGHLRCCGGVPCFGRRRSWDICKPSCEAIGKEFSRQGNGKASSRPLIACAPASASGSRDLNVQSPRTRIRLEQLTGCLQRP
jgi:hypothetical protein